MSIQNKKNLELFYKEIAQQSKDFNFKKPGLFIDSVINISNLLSIKYNLPIEQFNIRYDIKKNIFDLFIGFEKLDDIIHLTMEGK